MSLVDGFAVWNLHTFPLRHTIWSGTSTGSDANGCCCGRYGRCGCWPCSWFGFGSWSYRTFGRLGCLSRQHCLGIQWGPCRFLLRKLPKFSDFSGTFGHFQRQAHNLPGHKCRKMPEIPTSYRQKGPLDILEWNTLEYWIKIANTSNEGMPYN